jgi:hypothetical protein
MSSLLTSLGQVDADIRFLKALSTTTVYSPTTPVATNMPAASFTAAELTVVLVSV